MKQVLSFLLMLMPLMASAYDVEINGIYYNLVSKAKIAEVTNGGTTGRYSGNIVIPSSVTYDGKEYSVTAITEKGVGASAARAIIPNENATLEEVQAVYDALYYALREADQWNYPDDVTDQYIVNYKPVSNTNGWETPQGQPNAFDPGNDNAEFWNLSGYSLRQTIHNLPAGVYMLRAIAFTRTDYEAYLAAGDVSMKIATVDAGQVNSRSEANQWFNAGNGVNELTFMQEAEGDVEISLTADKTAGDHWTVWRSFQLFFRGDNADAIGKAAQALTENWEEEFVDRVYSQNYYDAVTAGIAASEAASTSEDAIAAYVATRDALTALRANADAYEALKARAEEVYEIIWDQLDGDNILLEMIEGAGDDAGILANIEDGTYTTEEAIAKLDELNERVNWVNNNLMQPGDDVTEKFVENPEFRNAAGTSSGFNKWTVDSDNALQNNAGTIQVVEQWNGTNATSTIDVYQYVNLPKGAFRLSTKGWYRSTTDYNTYKTNPDYQTVKSYLYGSASQFPFPDIYVKGYTDEEKVEFFPNGNEYTATIDGVTYHYPNNCTGAEELFTNENVNWYDMYVDFIATGEPVKIGIKGTVVGYSWTIWDDFKLTFLGTDVDNLLPVAQASIDEAKALLEYPMSNEARQRLNAAIAAAEGAADGNALIDAYVALGAVKDATLASIDTYSRLKAENEKLAQAIIDYADKASDEALANATALNAEIQEGLAAGAYTDEQVQEQIDKIADMLKYLNMENVLIDGIYYVLDEENGMATVVSGDESYSGAVTIPTSVTNDGKTYTVVAIGEDAFQNAIGLTAISIPSSVTSIGDNAFDGCGSLTSVTVAWTTPISINSTVFPNSGNATLHVPSGSESAYASADYWKDFKTIAEPIVFADNAVKALCLANWDADGDGKLYKDEAAAVTNLGSVFKENTDITTFDELQYFTGLTSISDSAFYYCSNLASIIIPDNVNTIGNRAFYVCSGLKNLHLSANVTSIEDRAFAYCSGLESIVVDAGNTVYDSRDNYNALIETSSNTLLVGCKNTTIPQSVKVLAEGAFRGCTELTSIEIPEGVTTIGASAFRGCTGLESVTLPSTITSIGTYAFSAVDEVYNLTSVTVGMTTPVAITANVFPNRANSTLYVPKGSRAAYKAANYWKEFKNIIELENGVPVKCEKPVITILANGKVKVESATEGATCITTITASNAEPLTDGEISLTTPLTVYTVTSYATKEGYDDSEVATSTFRWEKPEGDVNGDGVVNISDVTLLVSMILGQ